MDAHHSVPSLPHAAQLDWISHAALKQLREQLARDTSLADNQRALVLLLDDLLATPASAGWSAPDDQAIGRLRVDYPHFHDVVDLIEGEIALSRTPGAAPRPLPPLLLLGDPGVGKSAFCRALAAALRTPLASMAMSAASSGFSLGGLDRGWSTGRPGLVFELLRRHRTANPCFILDELDKVDGESRHSPVGALYQLLEPGSAAAFVDEFVGVPINAGFFTWLATANQPEEIVPALLSRFRGFDIPAPTHAQMRDIVQRQFQTLCQELPALHPRLPDKVLDALAQTLPRESGLRLRTAAAHAARRAAAAGRQTVSIASLDLAAAPAKLLPRPRPGFL